ncbi:unnamed protein product, partial [Iphiclides podalirius]
MPDARWRAGFELEARVKGDELDFETGNTASAHSSSPRSREQGEALFPVTLHVRRISDRVRRVVRRDYFYIGCDKRADAPRTEPISARPCRTVHTQVEGLGVRSRRPCIPGLYKYPASAARGTRGGASASAALQTARPADLSDGISIARAPPAARRLHCATGCLLRFLPGSVAGAAPRPALPPPHPSGRPTAAPSRVAASRRFPTTEECSRSATAEWRSPAAPAPLAASARMKNMGAHDIGPSAPVPRPRAAAARRSLGACRLPSE